VLIDWFTVGAQVLNFLILLWLMKRFLYRPVLDAIDAREQRIAAAIADADQKKADATKEREAFEHKNEEFNRRRGALVTQATNEANAERRRLLDDARQAADALSAKRMEMLQHDVQSLNQTIGRRAEQEVFAIARQALTDLASTSLEACMTEVFMRRLRDMDGEAKTRLAEGLKSASDPAIVHSAFDLPDEQRADIQRALNETFSADVRVRFETAPDLVSGIELTASGHRLAWSIAEYLASLEKAVGELLKAPDTTEATASPELDDPRQTQPAHEQRA
jgi:F-type H+-transporting ATPase subunit b